MLALSSATGGRAAYNRNDLDEAVREAVVDSEISYTLGFYPASDTQDGRLHSIGVKIAKKGLEIRYRKGYFARGSGVPTRQQLKKTMEDLLQSPINASSLGLTARVTPEPDRAGAYRVTFQVDLKDFHFERQGGRWVANAEFVYHLNSAKLADAKVEAATFSFTDDQLRIAMANGLAVDKVFEIAGPKDTLRIVVQDRSTGVAGSLLVPLGPT
jgi:hypothetical protein